MVSISIQGIDLELTLIDPPPRGDATPRAPLVFLHEGLGSITQWSSAGNNWPLQVCHATGRAGVVYARRGHGRSSPAPPGRQVRSARYLHEEAWSVLLDLLSHLGVSNPVLLGHSDGASIALLYASRYPAAACIAMAPHVFVEPITLQAIARATSAFETGDLRTQLAKHHADVDGVFWQWRDAWLSQAFRTFDIRADCTRITSPLLLIQGFDDAYGTLQQLDDIATAAPQAIQVRLTNCGHSPHRCQPQLTQQAIETFLRNLP